MILVQDYNVRVSETFKTFDESAKSSVHLTTQTSERLSEATLFGN